MNKKYIALTVAGIAIVLGARMTFASETFESQVEDAESLTLKMDGDTLVASVDGETWEDVSHEIDVDAVDDLQVIERPDGSQTSSESTSVYEFVEPTEGSDHTQANSVYEYEIPDESSTSTVTSSIEDVEIEIVEFDFDMDDVFEAIYYNGEHVDSMDEVDLDDEASVSMTVEEGVLYIESE